MVSAVSDAARVRRALGHSAKRMHFSRMMLPVCGGLGGS